MKTAATGWAGAMARLVGRALAVLLLMWAAAAHALTTTSTAISSSSATSTYGESVIFTATVTRTGGGTVTGSITFSEGTTQLGVVQLAAGSNVAALATAAVRGGTRTVTAAYSGDSLNDPSSGSVQQTVQKAATQSSVALNPANASYGQTVTMTATVSASASGTYAASPAGSLTFYDGATSLGSGTAAGNGTWTLARSNLAPGSYAVTASYAGNTNYMASTAPAVTLVIGKAASTTALNSTPNPSNDGASVTLLATVNGRSPSGTVTFKDGAATVGTASLQGTGDSRTASLSFVPLGAGAHSLTAIYAGDTNNAGSTSSVGSHTVTASASTVALSSSTGAGAGTYGQAITLTATVTGLSPTGMVTFREGASTLGTAFLSGSGNTRTAAFTTSALTAGVHTLAAVYGGDGSNPAGSASLNQTIDPAATATTLSSSANPSGYGQTVTFTATVTAAGTVVFQDGATTLATVQSYVAGTSVTFATSSLASGSHAIKATFTGSDTNYATSVSPVLTQVVNGASTSVALSASPGTSVTGQTVTFAATVTGNSPSGQVVFKDAATTLGTASLSGGVASLSTAALAMGGHSITAAYAGDVANEPSTSAAVAYTVKPSSTTTALSSSANPASYAQTITLTATVSGLDPTGTITFKEGATVLGTASLAGSGNSRSATLAVPSLAPGSHGLTAVYGGDTVNPGSTSAVLTQVVNTAATTATVTSSINPSTFGQTVTWTATVTGSAPTGSVTFKAGTMVLGTAMLAGGGDSPTASFSSGGLAGGSHPITADYAGDASNAASTSAVLTQVVNSVASTTTLTSSLNPAKYGQTVTFTATVSGSTPSGTVTFKDGTAVLGTATVASGVASYATAMLAGGSHSITAVYGGDTNNAGSTSAALAQTVSAGTTTTALSVSPNPSTYGQTVTFTASVATGGTATGTITFKEGAAVLGTATLVANAASWTTAALKAGAHAVTASYAGDVNNAASTSTALTQTVAAFSTTTTLSASANPSSAGQTVTFTATVAGSNPSGQVTFKDGTTTLGIANLTGASASLATARLAAGSHGITASYAGDANHTASTSSALAQTVGLSSGATTLTATPNPATLGQNVTLMARIDGYSPTGTVSFTDGGAALGTVAVAGGAATLSLNNFTQGSHALGASYSGDANNQAASASAVTLTVTGRSGYVWQYGYDAMGRPNTVVDPNGQATYTYYDSLGRAIQKQEPPNTGSSTPTVTQYGWNLQDSLVSVADPRNLTTSYTPDGLGNVKTEASPDRGTIQNSYDAKGNLLTSTDARGKTTTYGYDSLDRLTSISYSSGTGITFEYDGGPGGPANEKGELTKITDESGQTTYAHDAMGRLTAKSVTIGSKTFTVGYGWGDSGTALDKLTSITYPGGSRVNYGYDAKGWVSSISVNAVNANGSGVSGTSQALLVNATYNVDGNTTGWQWSDGKARPIGYDSVGQVQSYTLGDPAGTGNAAGVLRTITRDAAGRITGYTHTNNGAAQASLEQSFGYDNLNRLLTAQIAGTSTSYSYDENGNRTSKTVGGTTYANTISATSNRLTQTQDVNGAQTIVHDAAGRITSDGVNTYGYSDRGRMSSATTAAGGLTYTYNGLEQRAAKSGPNGTSYYVYDEAGQLLGEYDAAGKPAYETIYLGAKPVGVMKQSGAAATSDLTTTLYNVYADHIDTARLITRQDHTIVWRWDTAEAFGATAPNENPSGLGAFGYNQRFPGQVFDQETGLNQNWHREYNARHGRYIQSDPIGVSSETNLFTYGKASPLSTVDAQGLMGQSSGANGGAPFWGKGGGLLCEDDCERARKKAWEFYRRLQHHFPAQYPKAPSAIVFGPLPPDRGGLVSPLLPSVIVLPVAFCKLKEEDLFNFYWAIAHEGLHINQSWLDLVRHRGADDPIHDGIDARALENTRAITGRRY